MKPPKALFVVIGSDGQWVHTLGNLTWDEQEAKKWVEWYDKRYEFSRPHSVLAYAPKPKPRRLKMSDRFDRKAGEILERILADKPYDDSERKELARDLRSAFNSGVQDAAMICREVGESLGNSEESGNKEVVEVKP
jgi:hypothetical protein